MRYAALTLSAPLALMLPFAATAQDLRSSIDVAATAGYSNNPFAVSGDDTGAAFASLDLLPRLTVVGPQSTLSVSGSVRLQQYLRRYNSNDSYSGSVDYSVRPSERLTGHARLDVSSSIIGGYDNYLPGLVVPGAFPGSPGTGTGTGVADPGIALPPLNDLAIYGLRDRRRFAHLGGDVSMGLSARDSISLTGFAEASRYRRTAFGDYEGYGASLGYSRQVSGSVSLGVRGSGSLNDYSGVRSNTRIYSVQGTASARLSEVWSLDGALGVSFVEGGSVGSTTKTSLSGDVDLCRRGERSVMCATASRQVSPTGLVGSQYVTSAGANWSLKLSERDTVSWDASYSKVGSDNASPLLGGRRYANEFARFSAGYNRQLTERLRFITSANIRKLFGQQQDRPLDYGGQAGVSVRLGDPR